LLSSRLSRAVGLEATQRAAQSRFDWAQPTETTCHEPKLKRRCPPKPWTMWPDHHQLRRVCAVGTPKTKKPLTLGRSQSIIPIGGGEGNALSSGPIYDAKTPRLSAKCSGMAPPNGSVGNVLVRMAEILAPKPTADALFDELGKSIGPTGERGRALSRMNSSPEPWSRPWWSGGAIRPGASRRNPRNFHTSAVQWRA